MVGDSYKRPYLDSSVYIAAINGEAGRASTAKAILAAADRGDIAVVGSTWVVAEVIRMKGEAAPLSLEKEKEIDAILRSEKVTWYEVDFSLAAEARHLARQYGLKPGDAVHLATALRARADTLLAWDKDLSSLQMAGVPALEPYWYGAPELFDG